MDAAIRIYTTQWHSIDAIQKLLHSYLLKYEVFPPSEELFGHGNLQLPVVDIHGTLLSNPSVEQVREALGVRADRAITCFDAISVGASFENYAFLDYALKHGLHAVGVGNTVQEHVLQFEDIYMSLLKLPNPFLYDHVLPRVPKHIERVANKMYLRLVFDSFEMYTRSLFLVFDATYVPFKLPGITDQDISPSICYSQEDLLWKLKHRRVRTGRHRSFIVMGDNPAILSHALSLLAELKMTLPFNTFSLTVLASRDVRTYNRYLLQLLRMQKERGVRVYTSIHPKEFRAKKYVTEVQTDLGSYDADFIWIDNRQDVENGYVRNVLKLNLEGFLDTDSTGRTAMKSIFSMRHEDISFDLKRRVELLDRYIDCAEVVRSVKSYLQWTHL